MLEITKLTNQTLLSEFETISAIDACLRYRSDSTRYIKVKAEILRRMKEDEVPQPSQKTVDRFIRRIVANSRKRGFKVVAGDFAKLRAHLLAQEQ